MPKRDSVTQQQIDAAKQMPTPSEDMVPAVKTFPGEMDVVREAVSKPKGKK